MALRNHDVNLIELMSIEVSFYMLCFGSFEAMNLLTYLLHANIGYGIKGCVPNHLLEEDIEVGAQAAK